VSHWKVAHIWAYIVNAELLVLFDGDVIRGKAICEGRCSSAENKRAEALLLDD
jgi:hypothetical protein